MSHRKDRSPEETEKEEEKAEAGYIRVESGVFANFS